MVGADIPPIACTLAPGEYRDRIEWILALARDALRGTERRGLLLELRYAAEAASRVRQMVRRERECCAFLTFDVEEVPGEIRLSIRAPEAARPALDTIFGQFTSLTKLLRIGRAAD
jgi:hypothetical protein